MTKPRKYDNIHGFADEKDLTLLEKGPNFSTRGLWHTVPKISKVSPPRKPQLPKYDPLLLWIHYENFIEAEIMYTKKIQFYSLLFSEILFIVNLWYCKNFIQSKIKAWIVLSSPGLLVQSHFDPKMTEHFHVFYLQHFYSFCRGAKPVFYKLFLS